MVRQTLKALGTLLVITAFAVPVNAQMQNEKMQDKMENQQPAQMGQISGTVIKEKTVDVKDTDVEHQVVLLQTQDGNRVIADLGPVRDLEGMAFQHGQQLALEGTVARVSDRPVFLASRVTADGRTVEVDRPELARKGETGIESQQLDFSKPVEVNGEIVAEKNVDVGDMAGGNTVVLLKLNKGDNVVADLGPADALDIDLENGQEVAVVGNLARVGDRIVLMADNISADGKTAEIERFVPRQ